MALGMLPAKGTIVRRSLNSTGAAAPSAARPVVQRLPAPRVFSVETVTNGTSGNSSSSRYAVEAAAATKVAAQAAELAAAEAELRKAGRTPEIIMSVGKSPDQIAAMLTSITERQPTAIATRCEPEMYAAVRKLVPGVEYNARARLLTLRSPIADQLPRIDKLPGTVAVVSGGSADQAVAEECRLIAEHLGCFTFRLPDLGLNNGITRLLSCLGALRTADVVVVVSGLDGALVSVVAGLVDAPVICVPTSTGYGATLNGMAPLLAQLSCTTPGVSVVNIDNGMGGAFAAFRTLRAANKLHTSRKTQEESAQIAQELHTPVKEVATAKAA